MGSGPTIDDFSFAGNKLTLGGNAQDLTVTDYLNTAPATKVGKTEYGGGRVERFGTTAFNEDGGVELDATAAGDSGDIRIFDGASSYPVTFSADGYPKLSFAVETE